MKILGFLTGIKIQQQPKITDYFFLVIKEMLKSLSLGAQRAHAFTAGA